MNDNSLLSATDRKTNKSPNIGELRTITFLWTGIKPLLMHNIRALDKKEPLVKEIDEILTKPGKRRTDDEISRIARCEWELSLYWSPEDGLYIPSDNIEKCIQEGAKKARQGKLVEAAVFVTEPRISIKGFKQPKTLDELYEDDRFVFTHAVRTPPKTGSRQMKTRGRVPEGWELEFSLEFDPTVIKNKQVLINACAIAGILEGLGVWRPKRGRFMSEEIE